MAKNKNTKTPKSAQSSNAKRPKSVENPDGWYDKRPSWRFSKIDKEHGRWSPIINSLLLDQVEHLRWFEEKTWRMLLNDSSKQNHLVSVQKLCKEAQSRLSSLEIYTDELVQLRVGSKKRIFGIVEDGVVSLIWFDLNHEVYPVEKPHT